MSKHFSDINQLKEALRLAEILKEFYNKRDSIYDEWNHYLALIDEELDRAHIDYYDDDYYVYDPFEEWSDEVDNTIALPSDRELWILRQARNAANTFPRGKWPWEIPHIPEEAWKAFFSKYKLSSTEWDIFWAEYYLHAYDIFN